MYTVKLNIADIILALEFQKSRDAQIVSELFQGFLSIGSPIGTLRVLWRDEIGVCPASLQFAGTPSTRMEGARYQVEWDVYSGRYDLSTDKGDCEVEGGLGLLHFLWALYSVLLPRYSGLLVHASSISRNEEIFVFPAPSGTGKSTLLRNSLGGKVLSDEATPLRLIDGHLYAFGSPFRSDNFNDYHFCRGEVSGIYLLKQSPRDCVVPMQESEALSAFLSQTFLYSSDPETRCFAFQNALHMVGHHRPQLLELRNGPEFWRCIGIGSEDNAEKHA